MKHWTKWTRADFGQRTPHLDGFLLSARDGCEGILIALANQDNRAKDTPSQPYIEYWNRSFRPDEGDRVFGGPITNGYLTEYDAVSDAQAFVLPDHGAILFPSVCVAAVYVLLHRAAMGTSYTILDFTPQYATPTPHN